MKNLFVLGMGLSMVFALSSCKSQESAYKKAYEKAKQQQAAAIESPVQEAPVTVTPVTPVTQPTQTTPVDVSNVPVRSESVNVVSGTGLNSYSVVCGSFSLQANAERLQTTLKNAGYQAQIAFNSDNGMYRVIASTFADKASAVQSRDALRSSYPDAWLLYKK